jgi:Flp pilus assembly pilin Flp
LGVLETNTANKEVTHMKKQLMKILRRAKRQNGQSLVEYALILALISVVAILVLRGIGTSANNKLSDVNSNLQ